MSTQPFEQTPQPSLAKMAQPASEPWLKTPIKTDDNSTCFQSFFTYFGTIIFAFVVVCTKRNRQNVYLRFNAFQVIYTMLALLALSAALIILMVGAVILTALVGDALWFLFLILGFLWFAHGIISIIMSILLIVAGIYAYSGESYRIPLINKWAEKSANKYLGEKSL